MRVRRLVATSTAAGLLAVGGLVAFASSTPADPAPESSEAPSVGSAFGTESGPTLQFVTNATPPATPVETESQTPTSTPTPPTSSPLQTGSLVPIVIDATPPSITDPAPAPDVIDPATLLAGVANLLNALTAGG